MKCKKMLASVVLGSFLSIGSAFAQDFSFDTVSLSGTGCPQGTTDVIYSPDNKTVSVLFDNFIAEVPSYDGNNDNSSRDRHNPRVNHKICDIVVMANLPEGEKIDGIDIAMDYRGAASVDPGAKAQVKAMLMSYNGPTGVGSRRRQVIAEQVFDNMYGHSPIDQDFNLTTVKNIRTAGNNCASRARRKVALTLKSIVLARMAQHVSLDDTFAFLSMDSADMTGSLSVKLKTSPCAGNSGGRGPGYNPNPGGRGGAPRVRPGGRGNPCRGRSVWNPSLRRCVRP